MSLIHGPDRRPVTVLVTSDGRCVQVPLDETGFVDVSVPGLLHSLLVGLEGLLGLLITGSRRENGGSRKGERD